METDREVRVRAETGVVREVRAYVAKEGGEDPAVEAVGEGQGEVIIA